jgi:hypothetical protein
VDEKPLRVGIAARSSDGAAAVEIHIVQPPGIVGLCLPRLHIDVRFGGATGNFLSVVKRSMDVFDA